MCDTLFAPASATAAGAALFAKNSDRERNEAQFLEMTAACDHPDGARVRLTYIEIAQATHTYACLLSRPFWMWGAEMGANEHGVVIGNEAMHAKTPAARRRALTGMDLVRLALERATTAVEAVSVVTDLLERHGQGGDCGHLTRFYYHNGFLIADAREAFILETVGSWWALERVTAPAALSNAYGVRRDYDQISPELERHARAQGWLDREGKFDFAATMIDEERDAVSFGRGRCARGRGLLHARAGALTLPTMMTILRDHGERGARSDWTPAAAPRRTICMHAAEGARRSQTTASMVSQVGPGRTVHWVTASAAPCLSVFKPVAFETGLFGQGARPDDRFNVQARWWRHEEMHRLVNEDYAARAPGLFAERDALEDDFLRRVDAALVARDESRLRDAVTSCWRDADAAENAWTARLTAAPARRLSSAYHRSWARLSQRAGMARADPAAQRAAPAAGEVF